MINLNNVKIRVIRTSKQGVLIIDTFFDFTEKDKFTEAKYSGDKIEKRFLAGI